MRTFKEDKALGDQGEDDTHSALEECVGMSLTKTAAGHNLDFEGSSCWVELKTRLWTPGGKRIRSTTYPTTFFPKTKKNAMDAATKPVYCFFKFEDGLFYIQYCAKKFETYQTILLSRNRPDVKYDYNKDHWDIPVKDLICVT